MKKRTWGLFSFLLGALFLLALTPARAQNVDEKIKGLEQELSQLKTQQMELKKDATAATDALPTFSYRPGGGVNIEAADRAWGIRFAFEGHMRMLFESGNQHAGRTNGEIMGRRWRPEFYYCVNNCFYELQHRLDNDGFGTNSALQRGQITIHFEQINPWLPKLNFGMDGEMPGSLYRQGSGNFGAQAEYDLLSRNNGFNTGRFGNGFTLAWDELDLGTGRAQLNLGMGSFGEGDDGRSSNTNSKDFAIYLRVEPFTQMKNKWIEGFGVEYLGWFCNQDPTPVVPATFDPIGGSAAAANQSACRRLQIQDHGDGGRQTLFQFTPSLTGTLPHGDSIYHNFGLGYRVGPYALRFIRGMNNLAFQNNQEGRGANGRDFMIAHDIFLWSPKGFLTGATTEPGSILFGTHFERTDVQCGHPVGTAHCDVSGEFSRNRILLREWDLWYFLVNRMSVGVSVLWYNASNLRSGRNQAGNNLGVFAVDCAAACAGRGGDWTDVHLNFRWYF